MPILNRLTADQREFLVALHALLEEHNATIIADANDPDRCDGGARVTLMCGAVIVFDTGDQCALDANDISLKE